MHRRSVLFGPLVAALASRMTRAAEISPSRVVAGQMTFRWQHRGGQLLGTLTAPPPGWLAVGFNDRRGLAGTRFVIASVVRGTVRAEERIALVPNSAEVSTLGGEPSLAGVQGAVTDGRTVLRFSLPHRMTGDHSKPLLPGTTIHLMLAWAHHPDFTHHSAWRRHYDVVL